MKGFTIAAALLLAGCTVSPVRPFDDDYSIVTAQNLMGMSSGGHETLRAMDQAQTYCAGRSMVPLMKSHAESGVPALTALTSTVVFKCVKADDPAYIAQEKALEQ